MYPLVPNIMTSPDHYEIPGLVARNNVNYDVFVDSVTGEHLESLRDVSVAPAGSRNIWFYTPCSSLEPLSYVYFSERHLKLKCTYVANICQY